MKRRAVVLRQNVAAFAALVGSIALAGCTPKAGATCRVEPKDLICIDDKEALVCHDGKWEPMRCRGPGACSKTGNKSVCDQTVAEDKDVCNLNENFVCSGDKKSMLECTKNQWTLVQNCLGDRGCMMAQRKVTCDDSVAHPGDACREDEDYACSTDKKSVLVCRGGKFILASNCKGKNECRVTSDRVAGFKIQCDDSIANINDPCDEEGHFACSPDEKQILKCANKKFTGDDKCKKSEKCAVKGELVGCY